MLPMYFGRYLFGSAAILFGALALAWHDFNIWQQIQPLKIGAGRETLLDVIAAIEVLGGVAILSPKTARAGAAALGIVYLFFGLLWLPLYAQDLRNFDRLSNFFEQFSMVSAAWIVYATAGSGDPGRAAKLARIGYYGFAVCVVSFTIEQIVYLHGTAEFVPKWIPLGQMFWAVATTIAFALAAIALFTGRSALLAARLLAAMIVVFGLLIWIPAPFLGPHDLTNWAGIAENFGIAAAAWIVADYLAAASLAAT
jgi:hypothetical protein